MSKFQLGFWLGARKRSLAGYRHVFRYRNRFAEMCRLGGSQNKRIDIFLVEYKLNGGACFEVTTGESFNGKDTETGLMRLSQGFR